MKWKGFLLKFLLTIIYCPLFSEAETVTCVNDSWSNATSSMPAIDGFGYDFISGSYRELPLSQAWSKLTFDLDEKKDTQLPLKIYGAFASDGSSADHITANVVLDTDKQISFFYTISRSDTAKVWLLTYYRKTKTMFLSIHSFDSIFSEQFNQAPLIRGQIFKAKRF